MLLIWNAYLYTQDNPVEYPACVCSERTVELYDRSPSVGPGVCHVIDMECQLYTLDIPVEYQACVSSERTVGLYDH